MAVDTYSPKKVSLTVGSVLISGYMEGTFITVERDADSFTKLVGADGEVARSASVDKSGTITVTLMQTSDSNDLLSALAFADEATFTGKFPVMVKDANGTSKHISDTAWLVKPAMKEYGQEITGVEWTIQCANLTTHIGGNS